MSIFALMMLCLSCAATFMILPMICAIFDRPEWPIFKIGIAGAGIFWIAGVILLMVATITHLNEFH